MRFLNQVRLTALLLVTISAPSIRAAEIPTPESRLGFKPGADYRLTPWQPVVDYFKAVDEASPRVTVRELGRTTENRPYIAAIISDEQTASDLETHRLRQRQVADPRLAPSGEIDALVKKAKPVVLITCSIHSDETASTLMATELLHELASRDDAATREILENTILILVPSANPDGVEKVARWYEKTKGHPWEGSGMPELYHRTAGHDTNRDWFMLNLTETRILTKLLYQEWFPTITYDVHQMGGKGARLFVPPFFDPINPNLDPRLSQSIFIIGAHMANDLATAGKRGVLTNAMYDNWWNGGNRTTPQRHNMVGVLTEAASVRMASPVFLEQSDLRGATRGFSSHKPAVNFVDPWPGGWWRIRDIVDYELICARSILTLAARYRDQFQRNYASMARDAIAKGKNEPPYGWVVPINQRDPGTAAKLVRTLAATGVEVYQAKAPLTIDGITHPSGSWVLPADQPYRAHLKDMMERQVYPTRLGTDGTAEPPYDVAGWTMPLKMGVRAIPLTRPIPRTGEPLSSIPAPSGSLSAPPQAPPGSILRFPLNTNDSFRLLNRLFAAKVEVRSGDGAEVDDTPANRGAVNRALDGLSVRVESVSQTTRPSPGRRLTPTRLGLYHPHVPSMDEGWTRFVLEEHGFAPIAIDNDTIKVGRLLEKIDVLIIPSISARSIREGYGTDQSAPEFVGGIRQEGVRSLRSFVRDGGRLICLENSCEFAIEELGLPISNQVKGLRTNEFYCPGSIIRADVDSANPGPASGMGDELFLYFDRSLALVPREGSGVTVHLRYAKVNPLESGWLLGPEKIEGKPALLTVSLGKGDVVLFAFPPQHRGQTHGTFPLLFNSIPRR